jgi:hypothetical protein
LLWEVGVFFDAFEKTKASGGRRGVSSVICPTTTKSTSQT